MITTKNSAKAVIIRNNCLLLLRKEYEDGSHIYTLPGGTQNAGESLQATVARETREEIGAEIEVEGMLAVYEHRRARRKDKSRVRHKVEFAFICHVDQHYLPAMGPSPDANQVAVDWYPLNQLHGMQLDPPLLADILAYTELPDPPVYIEDAN